MEINSWCVTNPSGVNEIKNCKFYESFHFCSVCEWNFYLSEDKLSCIKVETKITDCEVYLDKNHCSLCSFG